MASTTSGHCYLCGNVYGKGGIKTHLLKSHAQEGADQQCYLLKIEGAQNKDYWLYVDVPLTSSLSVLDTFLRKIWLECCGHMSAFQLSWDDQIPQTRKMKSFAVGDCLTHVYDFGSTTETLITVVAETTRKKQKESIRLLARNLPPAFTCAVCGKAAAHICTECVYDSDNPFLCGACAEKHEHDDMLLPVTNSPRMGECAYDGELDTYGFNPRKVTGGA